MSFTGTNSSPSEEKIITNSSLMRPCHSKDIFVGASQIMGKGKA
jgi:hypothetical protein